MYKRVVVVFVIMCRGRARTEICTRRGPEYVCMCVRVCVAVLHICRGTTAVRRRRERREREREVASAYGPRVNARECVSIFKEYISRTGHTRGPASCYRSRHLSSSLPLFVPWQKPR